MELLEPQVGGEVEQPMLNSTLAPRPRVPACARYLHPQLPEIQGGDSRKTKGEQARGIKQQDLRREQRREERNDSRKVRKHEIYFNMEVAVTSEKQEQRWMC